MKKIFIALAGLLLVFQMSITMYMHETRHASVEDQTITMSKNLWKVETQFNLNQQWIDVRVRRVGDMDKCGCWGFTKQMESGYYIAIIAQEDMPMSIPWNKRIEFQNEILQHEVMHVVLTDLGVPPYAQDAIIERIRPSLVQPEHLHSTWEFKK